MQAVSIQVQAQPGAVAIGAPQAAVGRLAYIDAVRVVLTVLVIMVHAAITYGSEGDWTYEDPAPVAETTAILLTLFVVTCQSFFMGLFFFVSGYLTPGSLDRKGAARYWKDRLLRIGLPLVVYTLFLSKIPNYIDAAANHGYPHSLLEFIRAEFWSTADAGPTWFLLALLVFTAVYMLLRAGAPGARRVAAPRTPTLLAAGLVIAVAGYAIAQIIPISETYRLFGAITLLPTFFPAYILLFGAGILAYRNDWLTQMPGRILRVWAPISVAIVLAMPPMLLFGGASEGRLPEFMSGLNGRCALFSLWLGLACIALGLTLLLAFRDHRSWWRRWVTVGSPNAYAVYLVHPLVMVPLAWAFSPVAAHGLLKFAALSVATVAVSLALSIGLRRLPGLRAIL